MNTKIVLFGLVGMSLVLAGYSSSMRHLFAEEEATVCQYFGKSKAFCTHFDENGHGYTMACEKLKDGNWTCVELKSSTGSDIPPDLRDALSKAQAQGVKPDMSLGKSDSENNTKVPKDLGGLNDDGNGPQLNPGE